ncbi:hypothetical protein EAG_08999 [Camponotus floridanus]|uniref:Uncharacterized protein n=1 Tax=Camponotus floridanus TaxID=104421 RepID=E2AQS6_CAMFO|nr:hypothetical protein EAG_08999 [Camponotus floridanus]
MGGDSETKLLRPERDSGRILLLLQCLGDTLCKSCISYLCVVEALEEKGDDRGGMQPLFYRRSVGFEVPSSGRECRCFICCGPREERKRPGNDTADRWWARGREVGWIMGRGEIEADKAVRDGTVVAAAAVAARKVVLSIDRTAAAATAAATIFPARSSRPESPRAELSTLENVRWLTRRDETGGFGVRGSATAMNNSWPAFPHTARTWLFSERGRTQESVDNDLLIRLSDDLKTSCHVFEEPCRSQGWRRPEGAHVRYVNAGMRLASLQASHLSSRSLDTCCEGCNPH